MPRCFVTGAGGFIGSHLVELLVREGWELRALLRYTSTGALGQLALLPADVQAAVEVRFGDLRDASQMEALMRGCDVVFHLAALIGIPYSYEAPRSYVDVNVLGTQNVLEAALKTAPARVMLTSTSEVYGTAQTRPMTEAHPLHPQSPYAASKVAADQLGLSYHRSFGLPVVVARPFNAFGPRQSARAVIPTIAAQALAGAAAVTLGDVRPRRDFCYVEDTARGMLALAAAEAASVAGETFHLATGRAVSVGELAALIGARIGRPELAVESDPARLRPAASEVWHLEGSGEKIRARLGWAPRVTLEDGLDRVLAALRERPLDAPERYRV